MKLILGLILCACAAFAQHSNTLTFTWSQGTGDPATGFHIWRAAPVSGTCTTVGTTPYATLTGTTTQTYVDTAVSAGQTWCYGVTAFAQTTDSSMSNEVSCATPFALTTPGNLNGVAK
jgi:hypothetical protein